jgi:deoxyribodipyrimidine photo-lyase
MTDLALVWFRRDFRLADNPALDYARKHHEQVLPVYIHDPDALGDWAPGAASRWWLHHALEDLADRLGDRGAPLVLRQGAAAEQLDRLIEETGVSAVYWNRLYEPAIVERDKKIKAALKDRGLTVESFRAALLFEPWELLRDGSSYYKVFTPYWKRMQADWRPVSLHPEPRELTAPSSVPSSVALDDLGLMPEVDWAGGLRDRWEVGELAARRRLDDFLETGVSRYEGDRDRPDRRGTSSLSPYLHFGHLSPAQVVEAMEPSGELPGGKGQLAYVRELAWREFSTLLLFHEPQLPDEPLQPKFAEFPWRSPDDYADDLETWKRGRTGIPIVDAGMRELWHEGWMHNRVRMIVASYLTKNLLIPWQEGAKWFWDTLVDADLGNNTQGWQWTAGCGADAAPYFRVFNPELQADKFDPEAAYIHRWCPELEGLDLKQLKKLDRLQRDRRGYPPMQVDLKASRQRALDAYQAIKG